MRRVLLSIPAVILVWVHVSHADPIAGPTPAPISLPTGAATATGGPMQLDCPFDRVFADEVVGAGDYNALATITVGPNVDIVGFGNDVNFTAGSTIIFQDGVAITDPFSASIQEAPCVRYVLLDEDMTWDAAQATCESMGANLLSISDTEENTIAADLCTVCGGAGERCFLCWIGGHDKNTEGTLEWIDGSPVTFTSFAKDPQPGEAQDCLSTADNFSFRPPGTWGWEQCAHPIVLRKGVCESL